MGTLWQNGKGARPGAVTHAEHWAGVRSSEPQNLRFEHLAVATVGTYERERSQRLLVESSGQTSGATFTPTCSV